VQLAPVVDAGLARVEAIGLARLELGEIGVGAVVRALPQRHFGVLGDLPVDRPGVPVVVGIGLARLVVAVGHDLEAGRVDMDPLQPQRLVVTEILLHEARVDQQALHCRLDLLDLSAARAGLQYLACVTGEILE
jgi:hypothetical protein